MSNKNFYFYTKFFWCDGTGGGGITEGRFCIDSFSLTGRTQENKMALKAPHTERAMRSTPPGEERRLERLAKNMIVSREIPPSKMEAVRALMENPTLDPKDKYSTIIELIRPCPDKRAPVESPRIVSRSSNGKSAKVQTAPPTLSLSGSSLQGSENVESIHIAYRQYALFQKRSLVRAANPLGFWFRKRLIPSPRYFKAFERIAAFQELILYRLSDIMQRIVEDEHIQDPTVYNYLRLLKKWLMDVPFVKLGYQRAKWLDSPAFEGELKSYCANYFSFERIETPVKEQIILAVEQKLRESADLSKTISPDSDAENFKKEKRIYDYLLALRSFLPTPGTLNGAVDSWLRAFCGISSFSDFLLFSVEALLFRRRMGGAEIRGAWNIRPISVSSLSWECSDELLQKSGKDTASMRRRRIDALKISLEPYDQILDLVNVKLDGRPLLEKAFDDHWHIISKRRSEYTDYYKNNFFYFLDDCVDYFIHAFVPLIDGSPFLFITPEKKAVESSIFSTGYFEAKLSALFDLQGQLHEYRTANPNLLISYEEVRRIMSGRLATMVHIKVFVEHIGAIFYAFACDLFSIYRSHFRWILSEEKSDSIVEIRTPLIGGRIDVTESDPGVPLPFCDSVLARSESMTPILRTLVGKPVMSDSVHGGIFKTITAFCYQMSAECMHPALERELEKRREIKNQIALLGERD